MAALDDDQRDLGFGSVVARESRLRLLNRDGSFNVVRRRRGPFASLGDYQALVTLSWPRFLAFITVVFVAINALFATAYVACGPQALAGPPIAGATGAWARAFFFSVQTFSTIGYGHVVPDSLSANVLVAIEALAGLVVFALAWGIVFARFSRPVAKLRFSDRAVVAPYRGLTAFEFRIANVSSSELVDVRAQVILGRMVVEEDGRRVRRFHELPLERDHIAFFPLTWTIVHPIDAASPLADLSRGDLEAMDAEFLVILAGTDETWAQTVHARSSYKFDEVTWHARFAGIFLRPEDGGRMGVSLDRLSELERVEPTQPHAGSVA
ncbi:MAG TPA: ion channel [Planctomycetota bacterium]|nr:ion channel [Planctomycetota bacterium]